MLDHAQEVCDTFLVTTREDAGSATPLQHFRAPHSMWKAFSAVCRRRGHTAAADLIAHMTRTIRRYGSDEEKELLAQAQADMRQRRARKGGRPRKPPVG
jgi:hypothetical protein